MAATIDWNPVRQALGRVVLERLRGFDVRDGLSELESHTKLMKLAGQVRVERVRLGLDATYHDEPVSDLQRAESLIEAHMAATGENRLSAFMRLSATKEYAELFERAIAAPPTGGK